MTDHYREARTLLDQHREALVALAAEHAKPEHSRNPKRIADLYTERDAAIHQAKVHSNLAIAQAIQDRGISA